jgi:hypothetical protein
MLQLAQLPDRVGLRDVISRCGEAAAACHSFCSGLEQGWEAIMVPKYTHVSCQSSNRKLKAVGMIITLLI